jgi:hypothetical protein
MGEVSLKEYVDRRFDEIDKRVQALNEAKHQNTALVALIVSLISLVVTAADVIFWEVRR